MQEGRDLQTLTCNTCFHIPPFVALYYTFLDKGQVWSCGWGKYGQLGQDESFTTTSSSPSNIDEEDRQRRRKKKNKVLLRSKGSVMAEEDRYLFRPVVKERGRKQAWTDVCCGRWSTFMWQEEGEL